MPQLAPSVADKAKIQTEITALQAQLKMGADGATYSGSNLLSLNTTTGTAVAGVADDAKIVSAFTRNSAGTVALQTIDVKVDSVKMYEAFAGATAVQKGIIDGARLGTSGARDVTATAAVAGTVAATDGYCGLDADRRRLQRRQIAADAERRRHRDQGTDERRHHARRRQEAHRHPEGRFTQSLMDSIDRGVGQLVDADMNEESTRLQALQVQQQLGIQALSIANSQLADRSCRSSAANRRARQLQRTSTSVSRAALQIEARPDRVVGPAPLAARP